MKPIKRTKHFELGTDSKKGKNELLGWKTAGYWTITFLHNFWDPVDIVHEWVIRILRCWTHSTFAFAWIISFNNFTATTGLMVGITIPNRPNFSVGHDNFPDVFAVYRPVDAHTISYSKMDDRCTYMRICHL